LYVRNVLHIKLVTLQSIWKSGSSSDQICHSKYSKMRPWPDWKKINPVHCYCFQAFIYLVQYYIMCHYLCALSIPYTSL